MSLDPWQKDYCFSIESARNNFLLCGRQVGKTTAMSIRSVELCVKHFKKGEYVLICSITEKQAYHMLAKALVYAKEKHQNQVIWKGKDKPTKHIINFKNGTGILCYAAGETGEGLRGYTIKKLMIDEGSRMSEEFFIAVSPMLSVVRGSMDIASTPAGKKHKDGQLKFFYKCSLDEKFHNYYISAEDCPRHTKEFLESEKERLSELAYAQEYLAVFTDKFRELFDEETINKLCCLERQAGAHKDRRFYLGVDVAGFGKDECSYEIFEKLSNGIIEHRESIVEKRNYTTDTSRRIIGLDKIYNFKKIGIDDGGIGFGVYSELMNNSSTKKKTIALNNASRKIDKEGKRSKKLLKEEMYINLIVTTENNKIRLLNDDEVKASLSSLQFDEGKVFGSNDHIAEGVIRGVWVATEDKSLNIFVRSF